jgi:hypothetical protein
MSKSMALKSTWFVIGSLCSVALMASCSSDSSDDGGSGGTSASGGVGGAAGTTSGSAGTLGAGTGGAAGTGTGGASAGTAGASAGSAGTAAGTAGTAGAAAGSAGTAGSGVVADPTLVQPSRPQITDFTDVDTAATPPLWGGDPMTNSLTGGFYYYPTTAIMGAFDTTAGTWTITGNVANYSGFGMWFDVRQPGGEFCVNCAIDAVSAGCTGISFKISGTGPTGDLAFRLQAWDNYPYTAAEMKGSCVPVDPEMPWVDCVDMQSTFALPAAEMEIQIPFDMLAGGKPLMTGGASQMVGWQIALPWSDTATAYDINIVVKDVKFYGAATCGMGMGGAGGAGGMAGSAGTAGGAGTAGTAGEAGTAGTAGTAGGGNGGGGQGGVAGTAGTAGTAQGGTAGSAGNN